MKQKYLLLTIILFSCLFLFSIPSFALIPGDFDGDNVVGFEDLMILAMAYGSCIGDGNWNPACDLDYNGCIDFEDLMIFAMHYGECAPPSAPTLSDPGTTLPAPANYTVSWSSVSGATSYWLQEATSSDFTSGLQGDPVTNTSKSFSHTVTTTTTYYYRVTAINDCGQSGWSTIQDVTVVIGPVHNLTKDTYYKTIQAALHDADSSGGDTIEVPDGTYDESISFPFGKKIILQSVNDASSTTIRGNNGSPTVISNGSLEDTTLEGFTIAHNSGENGRGIYISEGFLIIDNCIISGNTVNEYGGGIYNNGGTSTITSSDISGNSASDDGGGIFNCTSGTLTITGSNTISGNTAIDDGGGICNYGTLDITGGKKISGNSAIEGGGIYNAGTSTIASSVILVNSAIYGGGINNCTSGTLTITGSSTISGNTAYMYGGGIHNGGTLYITSSTISSNTAKDGGGIQNNTGTLTITGSTISSNSATSDGGGIYNSRGTLTITLSVILVNFAIDDGGGIYNTGTSTIISSTICGNDVTGSGGGIYINLSTITIGGSHYLDFDKFNVFTDNKKNGTISAYQHICNSSGDCRGTFPNNTYDPNN